MGTGQVHTRDSQRMVFCLVSQALIKAKPIRPHTSHLRPVGSKHTSWCTSRQHTSHLCTSCLLVVKHTLCIWGSQPCSPMWKHVVCYFTRAIAPNLPGSYPSLDKGGLQVSPCKLLFYRSLQYSNLNLKYNFSLYNKIRLMEWISIASFCCRLCRCCRLSWMDEWSKTNLISPLKTFCKGILF